MRLSLKRLLVCAASQHGHDVAAQRIGQVAGSAHKLEGNRKRLPVGGLGKHPYVLTCFHVVLCVLAHDFDGIEGASVYAHAAQHAGVIHTREPAVHLKRP